MDKDIVPELLEKLQEEFKKKFNNNEKLKGLHNLLRDKKATYEQANKLAKEVGDLLSEVYKENLSSSMLPDGKMHFNIAKRIIEPTLKQNYDIISTYSQEVQKELNKKANLGIKAIKPDINQDRIDKLVYKVTEYDKYDEISSLLLESIKNFSHAVVDDWLQENVKFHYKAGLQPKIVRKEFGNCCSWCKGLVGNYDYPYVPDNFYRRHRYCRCTVEYDPRDGRGIQNSHNKKWVDPEKESKIENHKKVAEDAKYLNRKEDRLQYMRDIEKYGIENVPKSFDEYQKMKYGETKEFKNIPKLEVKDKIKKLKGIDNKKKVDETKGNIDNLKESKNLEINTDLNGKTLSEMAYDIAKNLGYDPLPQENVVEVLRKDSKKWIEILTEQEKSAINKYTYNGKDKDGLRLFEKINGYLDGRYEPNGNEEFEIITRNYTNIKDSLLKNNLNHDIIVYRKEMYPSSLDGYIYKFLSTSVTKRGTIGENPNIAVIVPRGANGAYIENLSEMPKQREFLFNTKIRLELVEQNEEFRIYKVVENENKI